MKKLFDGQCLRGNIQFTVNKQPIRQAQCHCTGCKKASATGYISQVFFNQDAVNIEGEASPFDVIANNGNTRFFARLAESRLFGTNSGRPDVGWWGIMAGSFSDSAWFSPDVVLFTKDKKGCFGLIELDASERVPNFEGMPT